MATLDTALQTSKNQNFEAAKVTLASALDNASPLVSDLLAALLAAPKVVAPQRVTVTVRDMSQQAPRKVRVQGAIHPPKKGSITRRVWDIADGFILASGRIPESSSVVYRATSEGINRATATTQYSKWRRYHGK